MFKYIFLAFSFLSFASTTPISTPRSVQITSGKDFPSHISRSWIVLYLPIEIKLLQNSIYECAHIRVNVLSETKKFEVCKNSTEIIVMNLPVLSPKKSYLEVFIVAVLELDEYIYTYTIPIISTCDYKMTKFYPTDKGFSTTIDFSSKLNMNDWLVKFSFTYNNIYVMQYSPDIIVDDNMKGMFTVKNEIYTNEKHFSISIDFISKYASDIKIKWFSLNGVKCHNIDHEYSAFYSVA